MRNIVLTVSYDGTRFCGWQKQDKAAAGKPVRTVQGELEQALHRIHHEPVAAIGSGRTDAGVHAAGQAVNFFSPIDSIPVQNYIPALNSTLPHDVRVISAAEADAGFHARFSATSRTYRYFLCGSRQAYAHEMPYVWQLRHLPDIANLNAMAACLHGELDCTTFSAAGDASVSKCRYIEKAVFYPERGNIVFEIAANAFLWKMVRSIVGSLVFFDRQKKDAAFFSEVLHARDRRLAGPTAPAHGLFLWKVEFNGERRH